MARESFVFYKSFYDAISNIEDKNLKADIYEAICELGLNENVIELDNNVGKIIMGLITPQIMANNHRYNNSFAGGRPKKYDEEEIIDLIVNKKLGNADISRQIGCSVSTVKNLRQRLLTGNYRQKPNVNENDNENVNDNDNVNVNVNENDNEKNINSSSLNTIGTPANDLCEMLEEELIKQAIRECVYAGVRTINYLEGILNNWKGENITKYSQWLAKKNRVSSAVAEKKENENIELFDYDWINGED